MRLDAEEPFGYSVLLDNLKDGSIGASSHVLHWVTRRAYHTLYNLMITDKSLQLRGVTGFHIAVNIIIKGHSYFCIKDRSHLR